MTYVCHLDSGQRLYLDNLGSQTVITLIQSTPGQQQQSTNRYLTGPWTAKPTIVKTADMVVITVFSATKTTQISLQGQTMNLCEQALDLRQAQSLQIGQTEESPSPPISPMEPLPPLKMGNMEMQMKPMRMRMGNMELGFPDQPESSATQQPQDQVTGQTPKKFCSQCGHALAKGDRFCSQCGQRL